MRVKQGLVWIVLALLLIWTSPPIAEAQLYRYKDTQGNWRYTDNLADVPLEQREDVKEYESIEESAAQPAVSSQDQGDDGGATAPEDADSLRDELKERKLALDQEYEHLVKESDSLQKMSANLKSEEAKKEFEVRKVEFNQRVKSFEDRRQEFESDLQIYNEIVGTK